MSPSYVLLQAMLRILAGCPRQTGAIFLLCHTQFRLQQVVPVSPRNMCGRLAEMVRLLDDWQEA